MFMDPSAFELEDVGRELADAGLETQTKNASDFRSEGRNADARRGSIGTMDGLSTSSTPGESSAYNEALPRAMAEDLQTQGPTYGRHSKVAGGGPRLKPRLQMAPPSSTPPQGISPTPQGSTLREPFSFPERRCSSGRNLGGSDRCEAGEGKFGENVLDGFPGSSSGGAKSRARVLAQQRELQRKKRQQALSSGGIRASDAASLSRGVVSNGLGYSALSKRAVSAEDLGGAKDRDDRRDDARRGVMEDEGSLFSPSVKQFSAPRQVEGDAYTAFNSNPLRNSDKRSSEILNEFDRRRSSRQSGLVLDEGDREEDERRDGKKSAAGDEAWTEDQRVRRASQDEDDDDAAWDRKADSGPRSSGNDSRLEDWDDRLRPSSKSFSWGSGRDGGDDLEARPAAATADSSPSGINGESAWRSIGRERDPSRTRRSHGSRRAEGDRSSIRLSSRGERSSSGERSSGRSSACYSDRSSDRSSGRPPATSPSRSPSLSASASSAVADDRRDDGHRPGAKSSRRKPRDNAVGGRRSSLNLTEDHADGQGREGERDRRRRASKKKSEFSRGDHRGGGDRRGGSDSDRDAHHEYRGGIDSGRKTDRKGRHSHRHLDGPDSPIESERGRDQSPDEGSVESPVNGSNGSSDDGVERRGRGDRKPENGRGSLEESKNHAGDHHSDDGDFSGGGSGDPALPSFDGVSAEPGAGGGGDASASREGDVEFNMDAIDLSDMKRFLRSPCPRAAGIVQCYIRRNKIRSNKIFPEYSLFMKEGDRFLMSSKKRPNKATSNYLISMRAGDLDRNSSNFLGKLRANFVGTEFQVFDDGCNPREQTGTFGLTKTLGGGGGAQCGGHLRDDLGCVLYASNVLGSRGPRKMQVAIPAVSDDGVVTKWNEIDGGGGSKGIERIKNRDYNGSLYMVNKPPRWNDQVGAYVLNFYGRVTMASVKNFQLVSTEDFDRIILQFGRVAKDEFTMDFQYPISPFQAFAITLSSFDSKIACD